MPVTTVLSDYEMNQPTGDSEIDDLLIEARKLTGQDWQVVVTHNMERRLFRAPKVSERWQLYVYVGGMLPWQVFLCASCKKSVFAYLCGVVSGARAQEQQCTYPDCRCPFDMGPDHQCLKGLPVIRKK